MGLIRNDKIIKNPYTTHVSKDDKEWYRFIQALNNMTIAYGNGLTGTATASFTATNKPGANNKTSPDKWFPILADNGTTYYIPGFLG